MVEYKTTKGQHLISVISCWMMAASLCLVQVLVVCAFCHALPQWRNLTQNPQALMLQQTYKRFQQPIEQSNQKFSQHLQKPVAKAEPLDKCAVADYEQIQCGQPGINVAECEAINCCFNGQECYYGKAGESVESVLCSLLNWSSLICSCTFVPVTVQCIRDGQFVVVVARDVTLPRLSLDSVHLLGGNDPPCGPVGSTPSFAIYQFPVTACGTSMMVSSCFWLYSAWSMMDWMPTVLFAGGQWICGVWEPNDILVWSGDWAIWFHHKGQPFWVGDLRLCKC